MSGSNKDKVVVITGASAGIGRELAVQYALEGAKVALAARASKKLDKTLADIRAAGGTTIAVPTDVAHRDQVDALVRRAESELGPVDVMINNAGISPFGRVQDTSIEDFEKTMQVNLMGAVYGSYAVLPGMLARRSGQIINVASVSGLISTPLTVPYCTSKFALVGFTRGLHAEVKKQGVHVLLVNPGPVKTDIVKDLTKNFDAGTIKVFGREIDVAKASESGMDRLPVAMEADEAARQIREAARKRKAEVIVSPVGKVGAELARLFPGATRWVTGFMG